MHQGIDDNQSFRSRTNYLRDGENIIDTAKSQFLPNIEIVNYYNDELAKSVLREDGIDMQELLTYFEPNIVVRQRNENFTDFDNSKRYIYPMKVCQKSDFASRGFNQIAAAKVKTRLCPDINEKNADHYIIKNLY